MYGFSNVLANIRALSATAELCLPPHNCTNGNESIVKVMSLSEAIVKVRQIHIID